MMMKTSLCSGILHWHWGSTGAVMTRGKDMVIIRTEDNKKADKDSRQELVYPGEIMQKVCQNWAEWRSVRGSGSPANEPDLCPPSNLCLLLCSMPAFSWCCRIRRTSDPATGFLAVCPSRQWGLGLRYPPFSRFYDCSSTKKCTTQPVQNAGISQINRSVIRHSDSSFLHAAPFASHQSLCFHGDTRSSLREWRGAGQMANDVSESFCRSRGWVSGPIVVLRMAKILLLIFVQSPFMHCTNIFIASTQYIQ